MGQSENMPIFTYKEAPTPPSAMQQQPFYIASSPLPEKPEREPTTEAQFEPMDIDASTIVPTQEETNQYMAFMSGLSEEDRKNLDEHFSRKNWGTSSASNGSDVSNTGITAPSVAGGLASQLDETSPMTGIEDGLVQSIPNIGGLQNGISPYVQNSQAPFPIPISQEGLVAGNSSIDPTSASDPLSVTYPDINGEPGSQALSPFWDNINNAPSVEPQFPPFRPSQPPVGKQPQVFSWSPENTPNADPARFYRIVLDSTAFEQSPLPQVDLNDTPVGFWKFTDERGQTVQGRNGWVPPILEEDPDYIRFVESPTRFQTSVPETTETPKGGRIELHRAPYADAVKPPAREGPMSLPSSLPSRNVGITAKGPSPSSRTANTGAVAQSRAVKYQPQLQYPSAANLLSRKSGAMYRKYAIPRGLQKLLTQTAVERLATRQGIPVPQPTETDVTNYFSWQQTRERHAFESFATPANIDIRLLGKIRITAAELIAFFPNHFKWHDAIYRLSRNGWGTRDIAGYVNYVRQLSGKEAMAINKVQYTAREAVKSILGKIGRPATVGLTSRTTCFTAEKWIVPKFTGLDAELIDYFLVDLAEGVKIWPTGIGARMLTRAVAFAVQHGYTQVKLSQIHDFIRTHRIGVPLLGPMARMGLTSGWNPDRACKVELQDVIDTDIDRVRAQL